MGSPHKREDRPSASERDVLNGGWMIVKSAQSDTTLEFGPVEGEWVEVLLASKKYSGRKLISLYTDPRGVASLFRSVAADWRGWEGARAWRCLEGDLQLSMEADGRGRIVLTVVLGQQAGEREERQLVAGLELEAGSLEALAEAAERHFRA